MKKVYLSESQVKKLKDNIVDFYGEYPNFNMSGEKLSDYCHVILENQMSESIDEAFDAVVSEFGGEYSKEEFSDAADNDDMGKVMKSFDVKEELNPKLWVDNELNSRVRLQLLDIADAFIDTLEVDWVKPKDIIFTGSLANYNWSEFSDIDLHIVIDFNDVDERTEFVSDYFNSKKEAWNESHDELKIFGYPVELYVQDSNEEHKSSGVYSLEKNEWVVEPEKDSLKAVKLNKNLIVRKAKKFVKIFDSLFGEVKSENDIAKLRKLSDKISEVFDKLKNCRKESLRSGNEMSEGNVIYKILRRLGYIERVFDVKDRLYDKINSIK